jgi:sphingosine kinase
VICSNGQEAKEWQCRVINAAYGGDPTVCNNMPEKKRILALLNPFGGGGKAPAKWDKAKMLLDFCHIDVTLKYTERRNHGYDILKDEVQIGQYDGIMTISGDGLIHEAINGAMNRPDKDQFMESIAFGFIPAGTANGLHKSVMEFANEEHGIHNAAFVCAKGRKIKMDLTELTLEYHPEKKIYMFLCMCWAVVSDIDLNSEFMRWAGEARFHIYGVYRGVNQIKYPG